MINSFKNRTSYFCESLINGEYTCLLVTENRFAYSARAQGIANQRRKIQTQLKDDINFNEGNIQRNRYYQHLRKILWERRGSRMPRRFNSLENIDQETGFSWTIA